jgi:hypothetical protein
MAGFGGREGRSRFAKAAEIGTTELLSPSRRGRRTPKLRGDVKTFLKVFYLLPVVVVLGVVLCLVWNRAKPPPVHVMSGRSFATTPITNLTANFFTSENHLGPAANDIFIEFRDAGGRLVDVGDVSFELTLSGPSAILHSFSKVLRTSTPGQYRMTVQPQIVGDWQAKLIIIGPAGHAEASFPVTVN